MAPLRPNEQGEMSRTPKAAPELLPELPRNELGAEQWQDFTAEWALDNGCGGSASGTVAGVRTRASHALLVAPFEQRRWLLWQNIEEEIEQPEALYLLSASEWRGGAINPRGHSHIERYWTEGSLPVWRYRVGVALLEKRIWMAQGEHTTYVQYRLLEGEGPLALILRVYANSRDEHALTQGDGNRQFDVAMLDAATLRIAGGPSEPSWHLLSLPPVTSAPELRWSWGAHYRQEAAQGRAFEEDLFCVCSFHTTLEVGAQHTLVGTLAAPVHVERNVERSRAAELLRQRLARRGR
jgi:predicted glycogen debranching enzyme